MTGFRVRRILRAASLMLILAWFSPFAFARTIYVDDDAAGANNGTSWVDAYVYLQEALADAASAQKPVEIRVAQGIYRPNQGLVAIPEFDWRTTTFQLINAVTLKGGYAGPAEPNPNARDIDLYKTILSGDLNANDADVTDLQNLLEEPTRAENSYHVVTGSGTDHTAVMDGFTIQAGNGDEGAGMYNESASPSLIDCKFTGNSTRYSGGAMYCADNSNPTLTNCTFNDNSADLDGGGMYNYESRPTLNDCAFRSNRARYGGGGMMNFYKGNPVLTNCIFSQNSAEWGGGMHNLWDCNPTLTDCTFSRNLADADGGGMFNEENSNPKIVNLTFSENVANDGKGGGICNLNLCSPMILNCTFNENSANTGGGVATTFKSNPVLINCTFSRNLANGGGGMGNLWDCSPTLTNCTFSGNAAVYEGGGMDNSESSATLNNCTFVGNSAVDGGGVYISWDGSCILINCILYGNDFPQIAGDAAASYSDVQGGWPGEGNIDADPLFADGDNGDYHLKSQAGRWDSASGSWVIDDVTSPCIDAGDPSSPVGAEPFANGGVINMGAYGGTVEASKSPSGLHSKYGGGAGEPNEPWLIYTAEQMNTIGLYTEDWDKHFKLMADIDLGAYTGTDFNIIGRYRHQEEYTPFSGTFDGSGRTISNFTYSTPDVNDIAMFAFVGGSDAAITDLELIDPNVNAGMGDSVASLVGNISGGSISGCYVRGGRISGNAWVGGLVAYNSGTITGCYSSAEVTGWTDAGGLAGYNAGTITGCRSFSSVSGTKSVGGLAGNNDGTILDSYSVGQVVGDRVAGGLVGWSWGLVRNCGSEGNVIGVIDDIGGLVGRSYGEVSDCYATGSVSGLDVVGGLVGRSHGTITSSYSTSEVIGSEAGSNTIGGLVGDSRGPITTCYSAGSVSADAIVGGLVGISRETIANSYSTAGVIGGSRVGGLAGHTRGTIMNCYAAGSVTGDSWVGGLVGWDETGQVDSIVASFWDVQTSGQAASDGGLGKTTAEMQSAFTFLNARWDFVDETANGVEDLWWINEALDYPRLSWEVNEGD